MPRFRKPFLFLLLLAALALLPRSSYARDTPTRDLESLCLISTDVVEATLTRHHMAGQPKWEDTFTATVTRSLEGGCKSGDQIPGLGLQGFLPAQTGQQCVLFIARKEFRFDAGPSLPIAPQVVDMLLVDSRGRVRRYYQWDNPGPQLAEGYTVDALSALEQNPNATIPLLETGSDTAEKAYPALEAERVVIGAEWAKMEQLRPLFARPPRPEDVLMLQTLVRVRDQSSSPWQQSVISEIARQRLAALGVQTK